MSDCLFCKIATGEIPSKIAYQDDDLIAFHDISPKAPVHLLIVPKRHIVSLDDAKPEDAELLGRVLLTAQKLAADLGESGAYRVVNNCGAEAGQSVFHIHFHLLAGRPMNWPPG